MAAEGHPQYGAASSTALHPVLAGATVAGRLLGASPKGIYLGFENARNTDEIPMVIALIPTTSVRLPLAMVSAQLLSDVSANDPVSVGGGELRIGTYAWRPARWFDPRPTLSRRPEPAALAVAAESLWNLDIRAVGVAPSKGWAAATAWASGDVEPSLRLLGDGPGLTPAGDDVVAGAMAACALMGTGPGVADSGRLLARSRLATTALSTALLACAARGQVVPQAAELLQSLGTGTHVIPALNHLRAVGSTSGTALALGIVAALTVATAAPPAHSSLIQLGPRLPLGDDLAGSISTTERPQSWAAAR